MGLHECVQTAKIAKVETIVEQLYDEFFGKRRTGIKDRFIKVETEHIELMETIEKMGNSIINIEQTLSNREAVSKYLGKSIIIGCSIIGVVATIVTTLLLIIP